MKSTLLTLVVIIGLFGCNKDPETRPLNKGEAYYKTYFTERFKKEGLLDSLYPSNTMLFDPEKLAKLSHNEIVNGLELFIPTLKAMDEGMKKLYLSDANKLLQTIKTYNLENKHPIYKKLIDAKTDNEKIKIYSFAEAETTKNIQALKPEDGNEKILAVYQENSYILDPLYFAGIETHEKLSQKSKSTANSSSVSTFTINGIAIK